MAPIANLTVRVSAQIAEFQKSFEDASKTATKFANDFEGIATRAAAVGSFLGNIAADIASSMARGLGNALRDAIKFSSEFSNAFLGLGSVARHFGADTELATKAARGLSSDGLLPLKDSATGLKNLLASGFNLDQSVKLMNAFKDSAAFGRQGALSFGDAIRSATEGVKNGNSILVDNAGITKNLSQILKEAGFSAQDLSKVQSDAGVRLALYNGILKESAAFTGDAAKLTQTYTGQVTRLESAYNNTLATIGTVITQNATVAKVIGSVGDIFVKLNSSLADNRRGFNLVSDGVIFLVRAFAEVLNVVDLVQTGFAGLQVVSNRVFESFANIGIAAFKLTEKAQNLSKYLDPLQFKLHAAAANEARDAYVFLEGAVKGFQASTQDAKARSITFGNAIQEVRGRANALAAELLTTRGKTVELGASSTETGRTLNQGLAVGATAASKAVHGLSVELAETLKIVNGLPKDFGSMFNIPKPSAASPVPSLSTKLGLPGNVGEIFDIRVPKQIIESQLSQIFDSIPKLLIQSFTGGGGLIGAFKAIGVQIADAISTPILKGLSRVQTAAVSAGSAAAAALGGAAGGGIAASVGGIASGLGGAALAASSWGASMTAAGAAGTVALGAATLGIGAAAVGAAVLIKHFTDHKGRDAVKDFAASFGGFDALRAKLSDLGDEGERLWIRLTQGTGRGDPKSAAAAAQDVANALANSGETLAAAAGFHTRAEFEAIEAQTKKTYDFMLSSGKFTASELARAFDAYSAAQKQAMEDGGAAVDAAAEKIKNLSAEFDSLSKSVSAEAPEEVMGIIEQQQRARMAAIAEEKTAIQLQADEELKARTDAQKKIEDETKDSHQRIQDYFNSNELEVLYHFKATNGLPGSDGLNVPALAKGGIVRRPTLALVGEKGPEAVVPLSQLGRGGTGGQPMLVQLLMPNGQVLLEQMVKAGKREAVW